MAIDIDAGLLEDPSSLWIATRRYGTTTTLELAGEWDLATAPSARSTIASAFERRPERLVLDLTRLRFIDSSGLHACLDLAHRSDGERVRLLIIIGSRSVWRPFEVCKLTERLPLVPLQPDPPPVTQPGRTTAVGSPASRSAEQASAQLRRAPRRPTTAACHPGRSRWGRR